MRYLTLGEVLALHRQVIEASGGISGLRDLGGLESAIVQPRMSFGEKDLYPALEEKAAALCFSLIQNHPFTDGNKRVGHASMEVFLHLRSCLKTPSWLRAAAKAVDLRCAASTNPEDSPASRALPTTFSLALWPTERILRQLLNGYEIQASVDEQEVLILGIAAGEVKREDLVSWLKNHLIQVEGDE